MLHDLLRTICMFIDSIVYSLISKVYELFMAIANTNIFGDGTINEFANRVYALLAIFMLFRLSFSVLTYIINPDNINDKSAGGGKLIGNILITIILLISVPWLFNQVMEIQKDLLNDNIIGKIILGTNNVDVSQQLNAGDNMAWTTFSAFFHPTEGACTDNPSVYSTDGSNTDCFNALNAIKTDYTGTGNLAEDYQRIEKSKLVSAINDSDLLNVKYKDGANDGEYVFEYLPLVSVVAGGFIAYILLLFCFQIAVRSVKLGVLQLIAPIPVISYLDPKQGKDGMFKKWLKVCGKTFADLFIRLAAIYFAIFIITEITTGGGMKDITTGATQTSLLVKVLIILGALMFAKELPKFIEEITGIKLDGGFSLNPFKNNAVLGGIAGGLVGAGMGAIGGFAGNLLAGNGIGNAFRGFGKGLISGGSGGVKDKGLKRDTFTRGAKAGVATGTNYANWKAAGSTRIGRMSDRMMSAVGARTKAQQLDDQIKAYDDMAKFRDDLKSQANYDSTGGHQLDLARESSAFRKEAMSNSEIWDRYKSGGTKALKQYYDDLANSNASRKEIESARVAWEEAQKFSITHGTTAEIKSMKDDMGRYVSENSSVLSDSKYKVNSSSSYDDINKAYGQAKSDSIRVKSSAEYRQAKANANANKEAKASK